MKPFYPFLSACFLMVFQPGFSQTWNGTLSSNWNTAANWTPNSVPGTSSAVIINNAAATYQPALAGNVSVASINMSQGILNLNGFTLTCSGHAIFTGDSLLNGKVTAYTFDDVTNMHMGGKIILEKTGPANESWAGNNKAYGDSLIIIWRWGALNLENVASSPDSIFGNLKIQFADDYNNNAVRFSDLSDLYVQNNFILDNEGYGTFTLLNSSHSTIIGGNLVGLNFSSATTPNLVLKNITTLGTNANGPFYGHTASINNCNFNGNFILVADSNATIGINSSSFLGADNLLQAGNLDVYGNRFGSTGSGLTILRAAHNLTTNVLVRTGNNKFTGDVQWETFAAYPGGITMQHNWYGADTSLQNLNFILKGNSAISTNNNGHNYVAGNVIIDGQGARKWIEFLGGTGNDFNIGGNFTVKNFTAFAETGVGITKVILHNVATSGIDSCGTFYCYTGDINNCSFKGNIKLIADSSQVYTIYNSSLLGIDNLFQAGNLDVQNNNFGQTGGGTTILRAAHNLTYSVLMRDGNNKFFGDAQWETYALYPGGLTIQQTFFGADSCLGNMNFILKGNSALATNGSGNSYVAGNVTIDAQGTRKWIQFTGGSGVSFNVGGNFTVKNFSTFYEPGITSTNVHLRNLFVTGTDTVGTFYCYTGDINNCSFKGNIKLIADSSQVYTVYNSFLLGVDNLFQAGNLDIQNNSFGQIGGTTILRAAHNLGYNVYVRDGNNKFFGDAQWNAIAPPAGSILVQQTFFGADSCMGNLLINVEGAVSVNLGGNNLYIGKGLTLQNNGSGVIVHDNGASAIYFIGTDTTSYSYSGSGSAPSLQNIGINRRGGLRLMSPLNCSGLILTRGIILSSSTNQLLMPNIAVIVGGGDSSYVDGPVKKTGNAAFTFPLGKDNIYAPLSITAPANATDAFTAQYFRRLAHTDGYDSTQHDISLDHLSRKEYWMLGRTAGTSAVQVSLSWKTLRSGEVNAMNDLRVAHWNGTTWKDEGNGGTTGTNAEGTIQSFNSINSFSPFTLASTGLTNPLPVRYISFEVQLNANRTVLLRWKTADEINNDHFEVERSGDGINWISLTNIPLKPSHEYTYTDILPNEGFNYYRIKEVDIDGKYFYTQVKQVQLINQTELFIWPNPASDELHVQLSFTGGTIEITDIAGRMIWKNKLTNNNPVIPIKELKGGIYVLRIKHDGKTYVEKFVKE